MTDPENVVDSKLAVKGVTEEQLELAHSIIVSGCKASQEPDAIKSVMFEKGIPFSKLNTLYSKITVSEGLALSPADIKKKMSEGIENVDFSFNENFHEVKEIAGDIAESVPGLASSRVMAALKKHFEENEAEFPRKPVKAKGRMGAVNKTLVDVFQKNKTASELELKEALEKITKTEKNAADYAKQFHKTCYAIANGMTVNAVLKYFEETPVESNPGTSAETIDEEGDE